VVLAPVPRPYVLSRAFGFVGEPLVSGFEDQHLLVIFDGSGQSVETVVASFNDITDRKTAEGQLHRLANSDAVTGLPTNGNDKSVVSPSASFVVKIDSSSGTMSS